MTNFSLQILFPLGPSMRISTVYDTGDHIVSTVNCGWNVWVQIYLRMIRLERGVCYTERGLTYLYGNFRRGMNYLFNISSMQSWLIKYNINLIFRKVILEDKKPVYDGNLFAEVKWNTVKPSLNDINRMAQSSSIVEN